MDDIIVFGSTGEHDSRLHRVLAKLADADVTLNKAKCSFKQQEIMFLGHVIGNGALKADKDKLKAVVGLVWFGLLGFNASATARVISRG